MQTIPLPTALLNAWAAIHGEYWFLWTLHWRAKGAGYYGDHLLYQRLYEARQPEIDRVAEVIAAIGGAHLLNPTKAMQAATPFIESIEALDVSDAQKALIAAQTVMAALREADNAAKGSPYAMAVNNALAGISDSHLESVYLLQQRINGRVVQPSEKPNAYKPYGEPEFVPPAGMLDIGEPDEEAASIFAMRENSRRNRAHRAPQILETLSGALGMLPSAGGLSVAKSLGLGVLAGGMLLELSKKNRR
jgi:DNA-binding ferritin-like protein